jgi:diadenosine tetraphosphatase ApaH/serine/threonine PP2A family protein phosphatase
MRIAIVADIHSNLEAFEAVLRHAEAGGPIERLWCLGDVVGYGPEPGACIGLLRRYPHVSVMGNHDLAAIGRMGTEEFNPVAAQAADWTAQQLSDEERQYLEELPSVVMEGDFTLVHGTLRHPEWEYLLSGEQAQAHFRLQETPYSLVGHSHVPFVAVEASERVPGMVALADGDELEVGEPRLVMNPGGVGQPRDGDPRAAYALYDSDARRVAFHRVEYDVAATQRKMAAAGLPRYLIERLSHGR